MGKQHVQEFRKALLRSSLLKFAVKGNCFLPFCGDSDLAGKLYRHYPAITKVYAADLDAARVATTSQRYPEFITKVADCDQWPFGELPDVFSVADFDAYAHPYKSFKAFWANAKKADRLVLFFTDGAQQAIKQQGIFLDPDGVRHEVKDINARRKLFNFYMSRVIKPWFEKFIGPEWTVNRYQHYLRLGAMRMTYWGSVISRRNPS
jgi:hypothetical protein